MGTASIPLSQETSRPHVLPSHNRLCHVLRRVQDKVVGTVALEAWRCFCPGKRRRNGFLAHGHGSIAWQIAQGKRSRASATMLLSWGQVGMGTEGLEFSLLWPKGTLHLLHAGFDGGSARCRALMRVRSDLSLVGLSGGKTGAGRLCSAPSLYVASTHPP